MIVVANTSPVCYLELIGHLDLLSVLFGQIIIPQAVHDELAAEGAPPAVCHVVSDQRQRGGGCGLPRVLRLARRASTCHTGPAGGWREPELT